MVQCISMRTHNRINNPTYSLLAYFSANLGTRAVSIGAIAHDICVLFMVALCNRADHHIFILFLSSSFFSSPNLSGQRLDVYHTLAHGVALVRI